ncbi:DUF4124 domain-containing protein [Desulfosarcina ovata]|uniref:DUF4124 domain-containing protein n=1 Tax=Desulfosarcina ovata TaxID=83564 RepID=UPI0039C94ABB
MFRCSDKWVDENGVAHYSNVAPPADQDASVKVESKGGAMPAAGKSNNLGDVLKSYRFPWSYCWNLLFH